MPKKTALLIALSQNRGELDPERIRRLLAALAFETLKGVDHRLLSTR